mgnify:CR=1 FL=1
MKNSAVEYALDILTGKWQLHILWVLCNEKVIRFNQIKKKLPGISNNALAKCLRALEENNIVQRTQYNEVPPRVEYSLTRLGKSVQPALMLLADWGEKIKDSKEPTNTSN